MAYLVLRGINKIYPNGFHAIHDFNLEMEKGEFIAIVGPSGCGKSTILRVIAGLEELSGGEILIDGRRANERNPRERGVAMIFQSYALYPHMSVYDNIAFNLELQGADDDDIDKKVRDIARILNLTDCLDRMPRTLSGGQRQRVAIGRALIRKVNIFLMDEPLSNLDARQRFEMRTEIIQIHRATGAATIYVTHDQTEAMTMADRIVVMKDGYVQQVGTPRELYFSPVNTFVAGFIGDSPMNLIRGKAAGGKISICGQTLDISHRLGKGCDEYEGRELVFGFRPEAVFLGEQEDAYVLPASVELTEMLGDSANVYVRIAGETVILKTDPHEAPDTDSDIVFSIPRESVCLFDAETGKNVEDKTNSDPSGKTA